jgi:hypothetical protein
MIINFRESSHRRSPCLQSGGLHKGLWIHPPGITPVAWRQLFRKITPARVVITLILLAGFYLLLIAGFGYFRYLPYFGFFLLCLMGFAFLVITFLLKQ